MSTAVMGMSTALEHTGGVPNPIMGVQGHFLELVTPTVSDKGQVVRAQSTKRIASYGSSRYRSREARESVVALGNPSSIWQDMEWGRGRMVR